GRGRAGTRRVHANVPRLPGARGDAGRDGGQAARARCGTGGRGRARRLLVDRPHHARRPREAARGGLCTAHPALGRADTRAAAVERLPLPVLRLARHGAREHLRPDAVPLAALLPRLQAAVRAVQDDLTLRPANDVLRLSLELSALAAVAYWGWSEHGGVWRWVLVIAMPLAVAALWGNTIAPKAKRRVGDPWRL